MTYFTQTKKFAAAVLVFAAPAAQAARPFFTDDARIVDQGHCQVESLRAIHLASS